MPDFYIIFKRNLRYFSFYFTYSYYNYFMSIIYLLPYGTRVFYIIFYSSLNILGIPLNVIITLVIISLL